MKKSTLKSMTGYGEGKTSGVVVSVQTLNRRFLDVQCHLSPALMSLEMAVRHEIAEHIGRGLVKVHVQSESTSSLSFNKILAGELKQAWLQLAKEVGHTAPLDLSLFLPYSKDLFSESVPPKESSVLSALKLALKQLDESRSQEGARLTQELQTRVHEIEKRVKAIKKYLPKEQKLVRKKLEERFASWMPSIDAEGKERIAREIALLLEKGDITEELVRLESHLNAFREHLVRPLAEKKNVKGKMLEFFVQELQREVHTLGAKSSDLAMTNWGLEMKAELEKMREQLQNVE